MIAKLISLATSAMVVLGLATAARADDSGFASMHDLRREGGKLCMSDHWHFGNGSGRTRKAAEADAIRSWSDFTDLEYGSDWARFSRAASKSIKCTSSGSGSYDCQIEARPCR